MDKIIPGRLWICFHITRNRFWDGKLHTESLMGVSSRTTPVGVEGSRIVSRRRWKAFTSPNGILYFSLFHAFVSVFASFFILLYQDLVYLLFYAQEKEEDEEDDWLTGSLLLSLYPFYTNSQGRQNLIGPICIRCLFWANHLWPEWQSHCVFNMATEILPWWVELVLRRRDLP